MHSPQCFLAFTGKLVDNLDIFGWKGSSLSHYFKDVVKQKGTSQALCCHRRGLPRAGLFEVCVCSFSYFLGDYLNFWGGFKINLISAEDIVGHFSASWFLGSLKVSGILWIVVLAFASLLSWRIVNKWCSWHGSWSSALPSDLNSKDASCMLLPGQKRLQEYWKRAAAGGEKGNEMDSPFRRVVSEGTIWNSLPGTFHCYHTCAALEQWADKPSCSDIGGVRAGGGLGWVKPPCLEVALLDLLVPSMTLHL